MDAPTLEQAAWLHAQAAWLKTQPPIMHHSLVMTLVADLRACAYTAAELEPSDAQAVAAAATNPDAGDREPNLSWLESLEGAMREAFGELGAVYVEEARIMAEMARIDPTAPEPERRAAWCGLWARWDQSRARRLSLIEINERVHARQSEETQETLEELQEWRYDDAWRLEQMGVSVADLERLYSETSRERVEKFRQGIKWLGNAFDSFRTTRLSPRIIGGIVGIFERLAWAPHERGSERGVDLPAFITVPAWIDILWHNVERTPPPNGRLPDQIGKDRTLHRRKHRDLVKALGADAAEGIAREWRGWMFDLIEELIALDKRHDP